MDPDAELFVITNGATKYALLTIEADAEVSGGNITGDRLDHNYSSGGSHEWGYGVKVVGDRAKVSDMWIGYCTGDGIIVSADDVTLTRVISQRNRRQGMSVFDAKRLKLVSCKFVDTGDMEGNPGTAPKAGVDIEPDSGAAEDIEFHDCIFANNGTANLLLWTRGGTTASITNVKVFGGSMSGAPNGIQVRGNNGAKITLAVDGCAIKRGSGSGIRAETGAVVKVTNNTFSTPTTRTAFELTGTDTRTKYDIYTPSTSPGSVDVGTNRYV
jgi:hypothetical protein